MSPEFQLAFESSTRNLAMVREQIRKYGKSLKLPLAVLDDLELAVDEAVTYSMEHAYAGNARGKIQLRAWQEDQTLHVSVRDFGESSKPKKVTERDVRKILMGHKRDCLGLYIMQQCMDSVRFHSVPKKYNETLMLRKLGK